MDTQITEILGKNILISEILVGGLEVAIPQRDRGIDLIVYTDISDKTEKFVAKPIQMKCATKESFSLLRKYSKFKDLILVYLWYIKDENRRIIFALDYNEALDVCEKMGWTKTQSWKNGGYGTTKPSKKLAELLEPYKMNSQKWWDKIVNKNFSD